MQFFMANNPEALRALNPQYSVEAEFGDECVLGSTLTLAHHGARSDNPPPCCASISTDPKDSDVCALSHIDLDTVGGCWRILGYHPDSFAEGDFWDLAGGVDLTGPHRLPQLLAEFSGQDIPEKLDRWIHAYWAWAQSNEVFAPRDGSALEVTEQIMLTIGILQRIFGDDRGLLEAGEEFKKAGEALNNSSFVASEDGVILRKSGNFTNHLYATPAGECRCAVVAYRTDVQSITISKENPEVLLDCRQLVQELWGPEAGGHVGIAESPRGRTMTEQEAWNAWMRVRFALVQK